MTTPVPWPAELPPRPNAPDYGGDSPLNSSLFKPDNGVTRGRRIAEGLPDNRTMSFDLTRAQYEFWKTFYTTTLKGGFLPVEIDDPVTGDPLALLIVGSVGWERLASQVWRISFQFEEL